MMTQTVAKAKMDKTHVRFYPNLNIRNFGNIFLFLEIGYDASFMSNLETWGFVLDFVNVFML